MKAAVFALIIGILSVGSIFAQRTVTNATLDKYRQQREAAESDYRQNYQRMGFPSPEELQRRLEQDRLENERLLERWSQERIEREKAQAMSDQAAEAATVVTVPVPDYNNGGYNNGIYGYGFPYYSSPNNFYGNRFFRRGFRQALPSGYVGGGMFWPSPAPAGPRIRTGTHIVRPPRR